ncbi:MBL fold metallo-hydrolase [Catenovulum sp. 2E275]|uniref:MBL fold metallo-hydrolase n=1 Tax=Catenovulum sp. 2E275 TaxID=2980497 RepID=UPI0021CEA34E|nr:MBL fold metallo-hydrolase [Catenovulum sp. 2E275]MCU4674577.1 MBL fold metallo-hydrolase [Catenovulum sp. 2E275]
MSQLHIEAFYQQTSSTISYLVYDKMSLEAAVIDSALDFDSASGKLSTEFAEQQVEYIKQHQLKVKWLLETHAHADHLSAAFYLKNHPLLVEHQPKIAIGAGITQVQLTFSAIFSMAQNELSTTGSEFDCLLKAGDKLELGTFYFNVIETPGHTPDGISYLIENHIFVGDTLFMPDAGTARCDFPGGDSNTLFKSIKKIHALPDDTQIWLCHDYQPNGRDLKYQTNVAESKQSNIHVNSAMSLDDFVKLRTERDKTLAAPKLLYPSLQVNIKAGELPQADKNNNLFFKLPVHLSNYKIKLI